ncbi:MAG: DUF5996 family protein [Phycisphaerae bacterium]
MPHLEPWPGLPLEAWEPTYLTLHRWLQMAGKLKLALAPPENHWWHTTLRVGGRGLTTGAIPCPGHRQVEVTFDFVDHAVRFDCSDGNRTGFDLKPMTVADFWAAFRAELDTLGVTARIRPVPVEVSDTTPFDQDTKHADYDAAAVERMWQVLLQADRVFRHFRGRFVGKVSPVQFYWGSFDLACTRFNGERAPARPDADPVTAEAYSHAVISHGFWPGGDWPFGGRVASPIFYGYAVPKPDGLEAAAVKPAEAGWNTKLGEFTLEYDAVRAAGDPDAALLDFLQSTYAAAADSAGWDRASLERDA